PKAEQLQGIYQTISQVLQRQFVVTYTPKNTDSSTHTIQLVVHQENATGYSQSKEFISCFFTEFLPIDPTGLTNAVCGIIDQNLSMDIPCVQAEDNTFYHVQLRDRWPQTNSFQTWYIDTVTVEPIPTTCNDKLHATVDQNFKLWIPCAHKDTIAYQFSLDYVFYENDIFPHQFIIHSETE
ncbi:MAG: hypothetical protein HQK77_12110, partial [Desulfobacterales bacterium]|nr:hypothetical protein [Desulfobacterales bacterium]